MASRKEQVGGLCLMCGQPLPSRKRRQCAVCGKPILKGHKFWFDGSAVKHRNCEDPGSYKPKGEVANV